MKLLEKVVDKLSFEQVMVFIILIVLSVSLFHFGGTPETLNLILGALIGAFTSRMTISKREKEENKD